MNKLVLKYPKLGSSANPEKLSMLISGILVAIIGVLASIGIDTVGLELNTLADSIVSLVELGYQGVALIMVIYGIVRKIYIKYFKKN